MLLIAWSLWKERNSRTFQRVSRGVQEIYQAVVNEAVDWVQSGFKTLEIVCPIWSHNAATM